MRKKLLVVWILLPVAMIAIHYGPGQRWLALDRARGLASAGIAAEQSGQLPRARALYQQALAVRPATDRVARTHMQLADARIRSKTGEPVEAMETMESIVSDPAFESLPAELQREARELSGRTHYYAAWVMRLESTPRDIWMEAAETARQNFRMLAEETRDASASGGEVAPAVADTGRKNLEAAVKLERMGLIDLMARPLPEEGQKMAGKGMGEQLGKKKGERGQGKQPGKGQQEGEKPQKGAGTNRRPPETGS